MPTTSAISEERFLSEVSSKLDEITYVFAPKLPGSLYKKGAEAVRDRLQAQEASIAKLTQALHGQGEGSPATPGAVARLEQERGSGKARRR
jgi:hypothetical protein